MSIWSYRDELKKREPDRVRDDFFGGAFGCPGGYFDGAPEDDFDKCRPLSVECCMECWSKPYQQERWRQDDN